jgi:hypothetical protein
MLLLFQMIVLYSCLFVVIPVVLGVWLFRHAPQARRPFLYVAWTWLPIYTLDALGGLGLVPLPDEALYRTLRQLVAVLSISAVFWDLLLTGLTTRREEGR